MSFQAKRELLTQIAGRYTDATGTHKSQILDEFIAATGYRVSRHYCRMIQVFA